MGTARDCMRTVESPPPRPTSNLQPPPSETLAAVFAPNHLQTDVIGRPVARLIAQRGTEQFDDLLFDIRPLIVGNRAEHSLAECVKPAGHAGRQRRWTREQARKFHRETVPLE